MANSRHVGTDFSNGVRAPHYTNGRLLVAEDLQLDQQAALERIALVGRAAGAGIVDGFNVTVVSNQSTLRVTAGLGINGKGDAIQLLADSVDLAIQPIADDESAHRRSGRFGDCEETADDSPAPLQRGAYLLAASPVSRLEGAVARKTCDGTETANCANQWEVEGVQFKIIRLAGYQAPVGSRAQRNQNLLAHWFYGSDKICNLMRDPFQFSKNYSGYGQISGADFSDCDLPLAVFYWQNGRIDYVDEWAARRRVTHTYPTSSWYANVSDQRQAEGEARFLQFQAQLDRIRGRFRTNSSQQRAVTHFGFLPPVGLLPVNPFELIYTDIFVNTLQNDEELLAEIRQRELSILEVFARVQTTVLSTFENNNLFRLENFFEDLLPDDYQIVHEDDVHDRLHHSWVQPPIVLPPPPATVGSDLVAGFDFVTAGGETVSIEAANVDTVFTGVFTATRRVTLARNIADSIRRTPTFERNPEGSQPVLDRDDGSVIRPVRATAPIRLRDDDAEPLVDILVIDELLSPYHTLLSAEMRDIIQGAIVSLSSGGGVFTGSNRFTAVTREVRNRFVATSFVANALTRGVGRHTDLLQLVNRAQDPLFYVVFVRHRPDAIRRPLLLPDLDD